MQERWFVRCMVSGACFGVVLLAIASGQWLLVLPFAAAGLWYGYTALREDGAIK